MLINLFERCMKRRGVKPTDPYDWEKTPAGDNVTVTQTTEAQPPTAPTTLPRHTKHTTTDNNQENIEPTDNKEVSGPKSDTVEPSVLVNENELSRVYA